MVEYQYFVIIVYKMYSTNMIWYFDLTQISENIDQTTLTLLVRESTTSMKTRLGWMVSPSCTSASNSVWFVEESSCSVTPVERFSRQLCWSDWMNKWRNVHIFKKRELYVNCNTCESNLFHRSPNNGHFEESCNVVFQNIFHNCI